MIPKTRKAENESRMKARHALAARWGPEVLLVECVGRVSPVAGDL